MITNNIYFRQKIVENNFFVIDTLKIEPTLLLS